MKKTAAVAWMTASCRLKSETSSFNCRRRKYSSSRSYRKVENRVQDVHLLVAGRASSQGFAAETEKLL
jgi:hypothetical protein